MCRTCAIWRHGHTLRLHCLCRAHAPNRTWSSSTRGCGIWRGGRDLTSTRVLGCWRICPRNASCGGDRAWWICSAAYVAHGAARASYGGTQPTRSHRKLALSRHSLESRARCVRTTRSITPIASPRSTTPNTRRWMFMATTWSRAKSRVRSNARRRRPLNFAQVLMGQDQHSLNPLAPGQLPGGALFAEMLLWHLRDAVLP